MKYVVVVVLGRPFPSLPIRGAWIEIEWTYISPTGVLSLPIRGAWIEIVFDVLCDCTVLSLPIRGAWIEISGAAGVSCRGVVAPHPGSVD